MDKSNWIASLTSISGALNGSLGPYACCINEKFLLQSDRRRYIETLAGDIIGKGYKIFASAQNFFTPKGTLELEPENVVKVFK